MQTLSICYRCRLSLFRAHFDQKTGPAWPYLVLKRHRSWVSSKKRQTYPHHLPDSPRSSRHLDTPSRYVREAPQPSKSKPSRESFRRGPKRMPMTKSQRPAHIPLDQVIPFFEENVLRWSEYRALPSRLESLGIPAEEIRPLLKAFVDAVQAGELSSREAFDKYRLIRFSQDLSQDGYFQSLDIIYSTVFFTWASDLSSSAVALPPCITPKTIDYIRTLTHAANRAHPADEFPQARMMHRKVIMHVGPTNSGKTHNALRALAAAQIGVYAGPLRLLAHEVWERLNLGRIVPAGMDDAAELEIRPLQADIGSVFDLLKAAPVVSKAANSKYVRACNMVTGEEQKIVDVNSGLLSCTVEMLSFRQVYDVAVVDEIQMIGDPDRGDAWTSAVLGLRARELHLCGEESAIPIVQALLKDTGDEVVINKYQRLTPLRVEDHSLNGNLSRVEKGDCIVTFNRSSIFALKQKIEGLSSMKCAVVYGRLPPEIRSEQAALFNDPESGYDVIIGSDAIGMGLNLKIKRIVFEAVRKFDGGRDRFLSVSQTKQIAGRAGRYGLHSDDSGGSTTTLFEDDLSFLRTTLDHTVPSLSFARIGPSKNTFRTLASILPPDAPTMAIFDAHTYVSMLPPIYRYTSLFSNDYLTRCRFIDTRGAGLTIEDRMLFTLVPISWRDALALEITGSMLRMHGESMHVDLKGVLETTNVMQTLDKVQFKMNSHSAVKARATVDELLVLESFHKVLVMYVWMTFRQPLVYHQYTEAVELKTRLEKALDWALQSLTRDRPLKSLDMRRKSISYMTKAEATKTLRERSVVHQAAAHT